MLRCQFDVTRSVVEARSIAVRTHLVDQIFNFWLVETLLAALVVVVSDRVIKHFALVFAQLHAGAHTLGAPTMFAVVTEQARIEFVVGRAAHGARAECRKHLQFANVRGLRCCFCHGFLQAIELTQHMHHAFTQLQCFGERFTQLFFIVGADFETGHRQLNGVFFKPVDAREVGGGQEIAIDSEVRIPARPCPIGQLCVNTFAVHDQRRQQTNVLPFEVFEQLRCNAVGRLRLHCGVVVNAMLSA